MITFDAIRKYISRDEIIKKELYYENSYCIFTSKKIYRGEVVFDNKITMRVDELDQLQSINYSKDIIHKKLMPIAKILLILSLLLIGGGVVMFLQKSVPIAVVLSIVAVVLIVLSLTVLKSKQGNIIVLTINFASYSYTLKSSNMPDEEIESIIYEAFAAKHAFCQNKVNINNYNYNTKPL